jgi:hypothetical protein
MVDFVKGGFPMAGTWLYFTTPFGSDAIVLLAEALKNGTVKRMPLTQHGVVARRILATKSRRTLQVDDGENDDSVLDAFQQSITVCSS